MAQSLRSIVRTPSALRSGLLTGLAQVVLAFAAAGAGALLAQKFGRSAETDGFLAAYGVYLVLVLAAQAFRMVVVPDLTRADAEGRLAGESRAYAVAFLTLAVPVSVVVALISGPLGDLITGSLPPSSAHVAARALAVLVPAAFVQLLAALAASALAALDSYGTAAAAFALGGIVGLVVFAARGARRMGEPLARRCGGRRLRACRRQDRSIRARRPVQGRGRAPAWPPRRLSLAVDDRLGRIRRDVPARLRRRSAQDAPPARAA